MQQIAVNSKAEYRATLNNSKLRIDSADDPTHFEEAAAAENHARARENGSNKATRRSRGNGHGKVEITKGEARAHSVCPPLPSRPASRPFSLCHRRCSRAAIVAPAANSAWPQPSPDVVSASAVEPDWRGATRQRAAGHVWAAPRECFRWASLGRHAAIGHPW